jgi:hypothetical protein
LAHVQHLLKRIGLEHLKLKLATQLHQVVVIAAKLNMKNVLTFPRQVVEFLAKNIMNRMEITF